MATNTFGIIGGGWRSEFYLRIARELPEQFQVSGMFIRDPNKAEEFAAKWGVKTYGTLEQFVAGAQLDFAVVSVSWASCPVFIKELARRNIPVLAETPPAPDVEGLVDLYREVGGRAKVQVAEQYLFQPLHAARIAVARSGKLGSVRQAQVSAAHGYHGISLIRQLLGVRFEDAVITGQRFVSPLVKGPGRGGPPTEEAYGESAQDIAMLHYGDKLGVFDFTGDQYFSWVRKQRVLVRGDRGEIVDGEVSWLQDFQTPVYAELRRVDAGQNGNLEGYYHRGIVAGDEWVYRNPFAPGRLTDDEIAIATCLDRMGRYARGGPSFYSLAEASQDHYVSLLMQRAIETGSAVTTTRQLWALEG